MWLLLSKKNFKRKTIKTLQLLAPVLIYEKGNKKKDHFEISN